MFGRKKEEVQEMTVHTAQQGKKGNVKEYLDSMSYLSRFVIEKKEALVEEEMKAIREIDKVKDSYTEVIEFGNFKLPLFSDFLSRQTFFTISDPAAKSDRFNT